MYSSFRKVLLFFVGAAAVVAVTAPAVAAAESPSRPAVTAADAAPDDFHWD
ncbi:hypothetical protein SRB17_29990 [Streptomyces sp. RB17]|uniref:hypothetical protein n=1 Tax=Streptomyces sp. RB17 TaxID=2585197 RepID=UPI00129651BB|nr:hypothetical protein [Streptomyces sp. RB17]MQY35027.1 hypothetical protein [Streptomyces sp. RB17]